MVTLWKAFLNQRHIDGTEFCCHVTEKYSFSFLKPEIQQIFHWYCLETRSNVYENVITIHNNFKVYYWSVCLCVDHLCKSWHLLFNNIRKKIYKHRIRLERICKFCLFYIINVKKVSLLTDKTLKMFIGFIPTTSSVWNRIGYALYLTWQILIVWPRKKCKSRSWIDLK